MFGQHAIHLPPESRFRMPWIRVGGVGSVWQDGNVEETDGDYLVCWAGAKVTWRPLIYSPTHCPLPCHTQGRRAPTLAALLTVVLVFTKMNNGGKARAHAHTPQEAEQLNLARGGIELPLLVRSSTLLFSPS